MSIQKIEQADNVEHDLRMATAEAETEEHIVDAAVLILHLQALLQNACARLESPAAGKIDIVFEHGDGDIWLRVENLQRNGEIVRGEGCQYFSGDDDDE